MKSSIWETEPRAWPKVPRDYIFLAAAFEEVGRSFFPSDWAGDEALPVRTPHADQQKKLEALKVLTSIQPAARVGRGAVADPRQPAIELPQVSVEQQQRFLAKLQVQVDYERVQNRATESRRNAVVEWIAERARNAELDTFGLLTNGGVDVVKLSPSVWNVSSEWPMFWSCQALCSSVAGGSTASYWLFLGRSILNLSLADRGSHGLTAKAEREAYRWLLAAINDRDPKETAKATLRDAVMVGVEGLSDRAFERAWGRMASEHPEWSKAGRKSQRRTS